MHHNVATARAFSNIAFIKYWGNRDEKLRLPANGSISMNLQGIETVTSVQFSPSLSEDRLVLNGSAVIGSALQRVSTHLTRLRQLAEVNWHATVVSKNNFPMGSGIASSASAFAALTMAASSVLGLDLDKTTLSRRARLGSGSASRSIPGGFVEWYSGSDEQTSYAETIAFADHWNLVDIIALVSRDHKTVGSTGGHALAPSSPLQAARVDDAKRRLDICRAALLNRDFAAFASVVEHDTLLMHAVMMTSQPALIYWQPPTLEIIKAVQQWRRDGLAVCFTIDAGPNVHIITTEQDAADTQSRIETLPGIEQALVARPGGPTVLLDKHIINTQKTTTD